MMLHLKNKTFILFYYSSLWNMEKIHKSHQPLLEFQIWLELVAIQFRHLYLVYTIYLKLKVSLLLQQLLLQWHLLHLNL